MSNKLANLLLQLQEDETTYYVLKGRELYTEDKLEVLSNDKNSTKISIIMPETINGQSLDANLKFYIDFLDGNNKPGVISSQNEIVKVISENPKTDSTEVIEYKITEGSSGDYKTYTISKDEEDITTITLYNDDTIETSNGTVISQNEINVNGTIYYLQYNTKVSGYRSYISKVRNENYEDSAEVSDDFPSAYADSTYYLRQSKNIVVAGIHSGTNSEDNLVNYSLLEWTLDPSVTEAVGEVTFSIRIEDPTKDWKWQSETAHFTVKSNLQEIYGLRKEIEENFVIQNREIIPVGDFKAILVKGDTNSNKLFYKMNRYFQGQDMLARKTWTSDLKEETTTEKDIEFSLYKTRDKKKDIIYYLKRDTGDFYIANFDYVINSLTLTDNQNSYIYNNSIIKDCITLNLGSDNDKVEIKVDLFNLSLKKKYKDTDNCYYYNLNATPIFKINNNYVNKKGRKIYQNSAGEWLFKEDSTAATDMPSITFSNFKQLTNKLNYELSYCKYESGEYSTDEVKTGDFNGIWQVTASDYEFYSDDSGLPIKLDSAPVGIVPMFNRLIRFVFLSPNKDYGDWNNAEIEYINEAENYFIFSWTPNTRATRTEGELSYTIEFFINAFEEVLDENQNRVINQSKAYSWSTLPSIIKVENNSAATASVNYIPNWVAFVENELAPKVDEFIHNDLESKYDTFESEMKARVFEDYITYKSNTDTIEGHYIDINNEKYNITIHTDSSKNEEPTSIDFINDTDETLSKNYALTAVQNSDILYQSVNCIMPSKNEDLNNYYLIYNNYTKQVLVFGINDSENTPFFPYLETRLEELVTSTKQKIYDNANDFSTLANNYGIKNDDTVVTIENIFNTILSQIIEKIFYNGKSDLEEIGTGEDSIVGQFITKSNDLTNNLQDYYFGDYQEGLLSYRFKKSDINNYNGLINNGRLILNVDSETNKTIYKIIDNGISGKVILGYYTIAANVNETSKDLITDFKCDTTLEIDKTLTSTANSYYNTKVTYKLVKEDNIKEDKVFNLKINKWDYSNNKAITFNLDNTNYCFGEKKYAADESIPIEQLNTLYYIKPEGFNYYSVNLSITYENSKKYLNLIVNSGTTAYTDKAEISTEDKAKVTVSITDTNLEFTASLQNNKYYITSSNNSTSLSNSLLLNNSITIELGDNYDSSSGKWGNESTLASLGELGIYTVSLSDLSVLTPSKLDVTFNPFAYLAFFTPIEDYSTLEDTSYSYIINNHTITNSSLSGISTQIVFKIASLKDVLSQDSQNIESRLMTLLYGDENPSVGTSTTTTTNINYTPDKNNSGKNLMDTCYSTLNNDLKEMVEEKNTALRTSLSYFIGENDTTPEAYENLSSSLESLINTINEEETEQDNELYETYQNALASLPDFSFEQVDSETALIITFRNTETSSE